MKMWLSVLFFHFRCFSRSILEFELKNPAEGLTNYFGNFLRVAVVDHNWYAKNTCELSAVLDLYNTKWTVCQSPPGYLEKILGDSNLCSR